MHIIGEIQEVIREHKEFGGVKMRKTYKNVIEMVKNLATHSCYIEFLLYNIQDTFKNETNNHFRQHACVRYQENLRFYMDEYPEQKELRKEWFENRKANISVSMFNGIEYKCVVSKEHGLMSCEWKEITQHDKLKELNTINTNDSYFFNRWIKRV